MIKGSTQEEDIAIVNICVPNMKWSEVKSLSRVRLFATPWTVAHQAPWSIGFSKYKYWSGLPFPSPDIGAPKYIKQILTDRKREINNTVIVIEL